MAKLAQATSKYTIHASFEADGVVEKPDVIGAIFGQTEGLLGADMDLRELQRTGRIGRIEVQVNSKKGKTNGTIQIPSSLDASETSLIAATLETIERIGPCSTEIEIDNVEDVRSSKRKYMMDRAKDILTDLEEGMPERAQITEQVVGAVRSSELMDYKGLPCGPDVVTSDEIVVCEGRADVLKLLRNGIKNAIAVGGTSVPDEIVELSKQKKVKVFLDGDRGGDLILKELIQKDTEIATVARAPDGKEVEELTKKEIFKSLREDIPLKAAKKELDKGRSGGKSKSKSKSKSKKSGGKSKGGSKKDSTGRSPKNLSDEEIEKMKDTLDDLTGTRAAYLLDDGMDVLGKIPVKELFNALREVDDVHTIILDGHIDQKLVDIAKRENAKNVIAMEVRGEVKAPKTMNVLTGKDLD